jgi:hypothetical protein
MIISTKDFSFWEGSQNKKERKKDNMHRKIFCDGSRLQFKNNKIFYSTTILVKYKILTNPSGGTRDDNSILHGESPRFVVTASSPSPSWKKKCYHLSCTIV